MPYPTLLPNSSWYKGSYAKGNITQIDIVNSHTPTGGENETWNADTGNTGAIKCYRTGTVLIIAGNGTGKIYANADSSKAFANFSNITRITNANLLDTHKTTDIKQMFQLCTKLISIDGIDSWNTFNVTNMYGVFQGCVSIETLDLSGWSTDNVTSMQGMFQSTTDYGPMKIKTITGLNSWNTSNNTSTRSMFQLCSNLEKLDLSNWSVEKVVEARNMFYECSSLTTIGDISDWRFDSCTTMLNMFVNCAALVELDVSNWGVSKVTSMENMFEMPDQNSKLTELDVSKWNPSSCTDMGFMFYGLNSLTKPLDVSNWDVSKVTNFDHMLARSHAVINGTENWVTSSAVNMNAMFHNCNNTTLDVSNFDTSRVQFMSQMFEYTDNLVSIKGLEKFDTSNVLGFEEMFNGCGKLKELDLSSFNTRKAKDGVQGSTNGHITMTMNNMFAGCNSLEKITIGPDFTFEGDGTTTNAANHAVLPTPSAAYIPGADGNWYTINATPYSPSDVPNNVAETYYGSVDIVYNMPMSIRNKTMIDMARAIRTKSGLSEKYRPAEFADAVNALPEAGGVPVKEKDVNFYDYDGTLLYSYTLDEIQALTELPTPKSPDPEYLAFQEWNWTLDELKALNDVADVGANYQTLDGGTKLFLTIDDEELLTVAIAFRWNHTIDWGDGTTTDVPEGTLVTHTYSALGDYVVSCTGWTSNVRCTTKDAIGNLAVRKVYLGNNISGFGFSGCANLKSIALPASGKTTVMSHEDALSYTSVTFIAIPRQNTGVAYTTMRDVVLKNASFPNTVTDFGSYSCYGNSLITRLTLPVNLTKLDTYVFNGFLRLQKITIPAAVTAIGNNVLQSCILLREIHMKPTTPPTLGGTSAFASGYANRVIYVPKGCLSAYQTATNWSTYASQMREEES